MCIVCSEQFSNSERLACMCATCAACQFAWALEQVKAVNFDPLKSRVSCPNGEVCARRFTAHEIVAHMTLCARASDAHAARLQQMDAALNQKYGALAGDVRKCPNSACAYFGFLDDRHQHCSEALACEACGA